MAAAKLLPLLAVGSRALTLTDHPRLSPAFLMPHNTEYRESGGMQCGLDHTADLYRPIPEVLAEHPGVDGYCYFEYHAPWLTYYRPPENVSDYQDTARRGIDGMRLQPTMCPHDPGMDEGPLTTLHYSTATGMVHLKSHIDCIHMRGDDVYCHAMGWVRNQRPDEIKYSTMDDPVAWRALAVKECNRFQATFNFTPEETSLGKHIDDQDWIWQGPQRNLVLHGYHKCLLGHAAEEMAYCQELVCLRKDGTLGHNGWCEEEDDDE